MRIRLALMPALMLLASCGSVARQQPASEAQAAEAGIKAVLATWEDAFKRKDLDGVMSLYHPGPSLVAFDVVPPLAFRGTDSYRRDYAEFFKQFSGPLTVEQRDVQIVTGTDIAFAFGLEKMGGTLINGGPTEIWVRFTEGFRKIDGRWYAVHEHISVPADLATGKARLDLHP